jgi:hypothetical protein
VDHVEEREAAPSQSRGCERSGGDRETPAADESEQRLEPDRPHERRCSFREIGRTGREPLRRSYGHKAIASDYWSLLPFVGDEAASLARSAATSPVPLQRAHRSFRSLSDDPYPLQWRHHL